MKSSKVATTVRIDDVLFQKLKIVAEKERRSINSQMEMAFEQCIRNFEKEYGEIIITDEL